MSRTGFELSKKRCADTPRNSISTRQTMNSGIVSCTFLLLVSLLRLSRFPRGSQADSTPQLMQPARLVSFTPFWAPATKPFHTWPLCRSPVPPAAGVFLAGRRQQHVGPGDWSRVERTVCLVLQCSAGSSSLVLCGDVTRQPGSVSTRKNIPKFRNRRVTFFYGLNVRMTGPTLSCGADVHSSLLHAVMVLHTNCVLFSACSPDM